MDIPDCDGWSPALHTAETIVPGRVILIFLVLTVFVAFKTSTSNNSLVYQVGTGNREPLNVIIVLYLA